MLWSIQWIYKTFVPINKGVCRFKPTCSEYAYVAIREKPLHKAFFLVVWRILRCNPVSRGGYDPVPNVSSKEG